MEEKIEFFQGLDPQNKCKKLSKENTKLLKETELVALNKEISILRRNKRKKQKCKRRHLKNLKIRTIKNI